MDGKTSLMFLSLLMKSSTDLLMVLPGSYYLFRTRQKGKNCHDPRAAPVQRAVWEKKKTNKQNTCGAAVILLSDPSLNLSEPLKGGTSSSLAAACVYAWLVQWYPAAVLPTWQLFSSKATSDKSYYFSWVYCILGRPTHSYVSNRRKPTTFPRSSFCWWGVGPALSACLVANYSKMIIVYVCVCKRENKKKNTSWIQLSVLIT